MIDLATGMPASSPHPTLKAGLQEMQNRYPFLAELNENAGNLTIPIGVAGRGADPYLASLIQQACLEQGVAIAITGELNNELLFKSLPTLSDEEITSALAQIEEAFEALFET